MSMSKVESDGALAVSLKRNEEENRFLLQNETKKKAEVAAYFKRFEEAERLYLEMDRRYYRFIVVVVFYVLFEC